MTGSHMMCLLSLHASKENIVKTTLKFNKETKGTHVFKNEDDNAPIASLYVSKEAFKGKEPPKTITVEIKEIG